MTAPAQILPHFEPLADCDPIQPSVKIERALMLRLCERRRRNGRFSLRAFALQLGIDSATLSQVLRGRRQLSPHNALTLMRRAGFEESLCEHVANGVRQRVRERRLLHQIERPGFVPHVANLSRRLRMSRDEINATLTILLFKGMVRMVQRDLWKS